MTYMTKIHFSGLMVFLTMENPPKVIIPKVASNGPIGEHIAYIAFRKNKAVVSGWNTPPQDFPPNTAEFYWVPLEGETITFSHGGGSLRFGDFLPHLKYKYCSSLNALKDIYKTGDGAAARVILQGGDDIGWHVTPRKRIETVVFMHSNDYVSTLTATAKNGATKTLTFNGEANIIIGNSDKGDLYDAQASKQKASQNALVHSDDFLFYYDMFDEHTGCYATPQEHDADNNPNEKDPIIELPPPPVGAIDIACSNSQYP